MCIGDMSFPANPTYLPTYLFKLYSREGKHIGYQLYISYLNFNLFFFNNFIFKDFFFSILIYFIYSPTHSNLEKTKAKILILSFNKKNIKTSNQLYTTFIPSSSNKYIYINESKYKFIIFNTKKF